MGYTRENFIRVREEYAEKNRAALDAAKGRSAEIHRVIPETRKIDEELSKTGIRLMGAALGASGETVADRGCADMENVEKECIEGAKVIRWMQVSGVFFLEFFPHVLSAVGWLL